MSDFSCKNCGLAYDTPDELRNHQSKFCVGSNYEDLHKLDNRYKQLKTESAPSAPPTKKEINQFVSGGFEPMPLGFHDILGDDRFNHDSPDARKHRAGLQMMGSDPQDLLMQAENLKVERSIQRQLKADDEKDVLSLLQELESRKERELRAHIEKEEIYREINRADEGQLGYLANQKKQELNKLAKEREAVRIREQNYMDEISKMEATILEQERYFKKQRDSVQQEDPEVKAQKLREVKEKEMQLARDRAQQVASVKVERERLERERVRIMEELERNKNKNQGLNQSGSRSGFRENAAAKRVGSALSGTTFNPTKVHGLEPSLKDKLIADQVRINNLKNQQQKTMDMAITDVDEVDVLEREMKNQPSYFDNLQNLKKVHEARQTPNKDRNLMAIQNRLEYEGGIANGRTPKPPLPSKQAFASPAHAPPLMKVNSIDDTLMTKLDDLEGLLLGGGQNQSVVVNHMHEIPQFQGVPTRRGLPPKPIGPSSGFPGAGLGGAPPINPHMRGGPTPYFPDPGAYQSNGSSFAPPQVGFPGYDVYPFSQPFADPALAQLAHMLQSQDDENKKLREVLENFGKNNSSYDNLEQQYKHHDQEIKNMAEGKAQRAPVLHEPEVSMPAAAPSMDAQIVFPDEFAFRQNDARADDLEVEERALMNLAAQEYDQLRVIQRLPKNSDIYEYKLKQYKELSRMRTEIEKVLQEQRLEKIQRDFKKQKEDEDRQLRHIQWMEQQKRQIVDGRINAPSQQEPFDHFPPPYQPSQLQPDMRRPRPQQLPQQEDMHNFELPAPQLGQQQRGPQPIARQLQDSPDIQDGSGLMLMYDVLFGLPRQIKQLQIVARTLHSKLPVGEPALIGPIGAEPDTQNSQINKILYQQRQLIPRNVLQKPVRIIFELQAPDPQQTSGVTGAGWTFFDLFNNNDINNPAIGYWKLPIYGGLTSPDAATTGGKGLLAAPGLALCIRIGEPGDQILSGKVDHTTSHTNYTVPIYHQQAYDQGAQKALLSQQQQDKQKEKEQAQKQVTLADKKDPNYKNNGVRVRINFLLNQLPHQSLSIRYSIYDKGGQVVKDSKGGQCSKNLPIVPDTQKQDVFEEQKIDLSTGIAQVSQNSGVFTVLQDTIMRPINQEIIFNRDLYQLFWDKNKSPLLLTAEIFAKLPGKQGPQPVAINQFEVCDAQTGQIKYGFFSEQLQNVQTLQYLPGEFIGFTISDPDKPEPLARITPQLKTPESLNNIGLKPNPQQQKLLAEDPPLDRPFTGEISEQLIKQDKRQWDPKTIATLQEDIDIYIDAARHLPDNVTITRVTARIVDTQCKDLQRPESVLALIDQSSHKNQYYGMKVEVRPGNKKISPTAQLYITIETLDISNNEARIVGKTIHPLFIHANKEKRGEPVESENATDPTIYLGNYQLGIYSVIPNNQPPFTFAKVMYNPRVPTATLLIRVMKAQVDQATGQTITISQLPPDERERSKILPPDYKEGSYSNELLKISPAEEEALKYRRRRVNPPLQKIIDILLLSSGMNPETTSTQDMQKQLEAMTKTTDKSSLLDLNFHSQYEPALGFRVSVEAVHDNKIKAFYCVLSSVIPPASYYDPNRVGGPKDVFTFTEPNFDLRSSTSASYRFDSGDAVLKGHKPDKPGMSVLFDIKAYLPDQDKFVDYGFAVLPVLTTLNTDADTDTTEYYVASGVFSIPVYKGKPSEQIVSVLRENNNPFGQLERMREGKQVNYLETCSIIAKIVDSQREYHFGLRTIEQETPSVAYIKDAKLKKTYTFKVLDGGVFSKPVQLKELVPKAWKEDREGFKVYFKKKFREFIGLQSKKQGADAQGGEQIQGQ